MCFSLLSVCVHDLFPDRLKALTHLGKRGGWSHGEERHRDCLGREAKRKLLSFKIES